MCLPLDCSSELALPVAANPWSPATPVQRLNGPSGVLSFHADLRTLVLMRHKASLLGQQGRARFGLFDQLNAAVDGEHFLSLSAGLPGISNTHTRIQAELHLHMHTSTSSVLLFFFLFVFFLVPVSVSCTISTVRRSTCSPLRVIRLKITLRIHEVGSWIYDFAVFSFVLFSRLSFHPWTGSWGRAVSAVDSNAAVGEFFFFFEESGGLLESVSKGAVLVSVVDFKVPLLYLI